MWRHFRTRLAGMLDPDDARARRARDYAVHDESLRPAARSGRIAAAQLGHGLSELVAGVGQLVRGGIPLLAGLVSALVSFGAVAVAGYVAQERLALPWPLVLAVVLVTAHALHRLFRLP
jgi:hypothetical protein